MPTNPPPGALPRPPRRITPDVFYTSYLPALWESMMAHGTVVLPQQAATLTLTVDNTTYALTLGPQGLTVASAPCASQLVAVRCDLEAWRTSIALVLPMVLNFADARPKAAHLMLQHLCTSVSEPARLQELHAMAGGVQVSYVDDAGDTHDFAVSVGSDAKVRAKVTVHDADLQKMLETGNAAALLLQSRLQIEGDAGYLLRLAQWGR